MIYEPKLTINGKACNAKDNDYCSLTIENANGIYRATLHAKQNINSLAFSVCAKTDYTSKKIFVNGYQSWTPSREYSATDRQAHLTLWCRFLNMFHEFTTYGDYSFTRHRYSTGYFHSFSYGYITEDTERGITLIGSLNERTGYTIMYFDMPNGSLELVKDVEGLSISAGDSYELMSFVEITDSYDAAFDKYFELMNIRKPRATHRNGYTSWYNYYSGVRETDILRDLKHMTESGVDAQIFQIDDGYQTAVGDWLSINADKFPNGMKPIADAITAKGYTAGLWLAPFAAEKNSKIFHEHPDWLVHDNKGNKVFAGGNWSGFYTLDIDNPTARAYIAECFRTVIHDWGFDMVKLDFLYEAAIIPRNNKTRGQLMCEAMDFVRECVGADKWILGCGVPMWPSFGVVDFCRIGADIALNWRQKPYFKRYHLEGVSSTNAVNNTIFRRHLDGRAFCNDPDVCLLRDYNIDLSSEQRTLLATVNKAFGNLLFLSDDVATYNEEQRKVFLYTMDNAVITQKTGKYLDDKNVQISFTENGVTKTLVFDITTGIEK